MKTVAAGVLAGLLAGALAVAVFAVVGARLAEHLRPEPLTWEAID